MKVREIVKKMMKEDRDNLTLIISLRKKERTHQVNILSVAPVLTESTKNMIL